jgi:hypothetical protein
VARPEQPDAARAELGNQLTIGASLRPPPSYWRGVIKQKSSEMKPALWRCEPGQGARHHLCGRGG